MQTICTSLQTDNHINNLITQIFTGQMLFLMPNQQRQSTKGRKRKQVKNACIPEIPQVDNREADIMLNDESFIWMLVGQ